MKATILHKPSKPLKRGQNVTVELGPGYTLQSHIIGFSGADLLLDGYPHPVERRRVR